MDEVVVPGFEGGVKFVVVLLWLVFTLIVTAFRLTRALYVRWREGA